MRPLLIFRCMGSEEQKDLEKILYNEEQIDRIVKHVLGMKYPGIGNKIVQNSYEIVNRLKKLSPSDYQTNFKVRMDDGLVYEGSIRHIGPEGMTKDVVLIREDYAKIKSRKYFGLYSPKEGYLADDHQIKSGHSFAHTVSHAPNDEITWDKIVNGEIQNSSII